jgi:hypothetical protein
MPIYCKHDGTDHPIMAIYCLTCGRPLRGEQGKVRTETVPRVSDPTWEYRDVNVQLHMTWKGGTPQEFAPKVDPQLMRNTAVVCGKDWTPAEPVSFAWLYTHGRITMAPAGLSGRLNPHNGSKRVSAATIRLKRSI